MDSLSLIMKHLNFVSPFIHSSFIVSTTTMAGNQRKNGFSKATAITIDDSSDDEVNLINMSDENSFQKTPRSVMKKNFIRKLFPPRQR